MWEQSADGQLSLPGVFEGDADQKTQSPDVLKRANVLIEASYRSSLACTKIIVSGLSRLQHGKSDGFAVRFSTGELKEMLHLKSSQAVYQHMRSDVKVLASQVFYIDDPSMKQVAAASIITDAVYTGGCLTISFNKRIEPYIFRLKNSYTPMKESILMSFEGRMNFGFRIYEILRIYRYKISSRNPFYMKRYGLSELKLTIGAVDTNDTEVRKAMEKKIDPDIIVNEIVPQGRALYPRWADFKKNILDPAVREINTKTDIYVDYEPERKGVGGKVGAVLFRISKNERFEEKEKILKEERRRSNGDAVVDFSMIEMFDDLIEEPFKTQTKVKIIEAADLDMERVEAVYRLAKKQPSIDNLAGWMIKALQEGWWDEQPIPAMKGLTYEEAKKIDELTEMANADFMEFQRTGKSPFETRKKSWEEEEPVSESYEQERLMGEFVSLRGHA